MATKTLTPVRGSRKMPAALPDDVELPVAPLLMALEQGAQTRSSHRRQDGRTTALPQVYRIILGRYLKGLRERHTALTQEEVAQHLGGLWKTAISAVEVGRSTISPQHLLKLADLYGVDRQEFGKTVLRWTNPWVWALIYGSDQGTEIDEINLMPRRKIK